MTGSDPKADLHRYLQEARDALLWKLDGLTEYDIRRPLVPTGTNLLGLVKHLALVEQGYFGDTFGSPSDDKIPWDETDPNSDMFAARKNHARSLPACTGGRVRNRMPRSTRWRWTPSAMCPGGRRRATRSRCTTF